MSVFQHLKHITLNVNTAIKVFFIESLQRNLATASILELVRLGVEGEVVLHWQTRIRSLFIFASRKGRGERPVACENGDGGEDGEEDGEFETTAYFPGEVEGDQGDGGEEERVGEGVISGSIGGKRCVLD